jgi:hypothetical protein
MEPEVCATCEGLTPSPAGWPPIEGAVSCFNFVGLVVILTQPVAQSTCGSCHCVAVGVVAVSIVPELVYEGAHTYRDCLLESCTVCDSLPGVHKPVMY